MGTRLGLQRGRKGGRANGRGRNGWRVISGGGTNFSVWPQVGQFSDSRASARSQRPRESQSGFMHWTVEPGINAMKSLPFGRTPRGLSFPWRPEKSEQSRKSKDCVSGELCSQRKRATTCSGIVAKLWKRRSTGAKVVSEFAQLSYMKSPRHHARSTSERRERNGKPSRLGGCS